MAFVGDVFGLNSVYEKQLENVENTNHASWPEDGQYGYYAGGRQWVPPTPPSYVYVVDRLDFSTQTVTQSTGLPGNTGLGYAHGISGNTNGYIFGGLTPAISTCQVKRIDFSSETYSLPGNDFPTNLTDSATISVTNINRGYIFGGYAPGPNVMLDDIKSFDTSTESFSVLTDTIPQTNMRASSNVHNKNYGYFMGGQGPGSVFLSSTRRLDISSETIEDISTTIGPDRTWHAATSSQEYGYIFGGIRDNPTPPPSYYYYSKTGRLDFNNETFNELPSGAQPPLTKRTSGACSTNNYGFLGGGYWEPLGAIQYNQVSRLDFQTDTMSQPGGNLTMSKDSMATVQSKSTFIKNPRIGNAGYHVNTSKIHRYSFSTGTVTVTDTVANTGPTGLTFSAGLVSRRLSNGYAVAGALSGTSPGQKDNRISKFDTGNETSNLLPNATIHADKAYLASFSGDEYGYFGGGYQYQFNVYPAVRFCRIDRLDFTTETDSQATFAYLPSQRMYFEGMSSRRYGYFVGGSETINVGPYHAELTRVEFSTETKSLNPVAHPAGVWKHSTFTNNLFGYVVGGQIPASGTLCTIRRLDFATDSFVNTTNDMLVSMIDHCTNQDDSYGYAIGGNTGDSPYTCKINRLEFSTETTSQPGDIPTGIGGSPAAWSV